MLEYTLRDIENLEENMNEITSAWKAGDAGRLDDLLTGYLDDSPGLEAVFERLFSERDRDMARTDRRTAYERRHLLYRGGGRTPRGR